MVANVTKLAVGFSTSAVLALAAFSAHAADTTKPRQCVATVPCASPVHHAPKHKRIAPTPVAAMAPPPPPVPPAAAAPPITVNAYITPPAAPTAQAPQSGDINAFIRNMKATVKGQAEALKEGDANGECTADQMKRIGGNFVMGYVNKVDIQCKASVQIIAQADGNGNPMSFTSTAMPAVGVQPKIVERRGLIDAGAIVAGQIFAPVVSSIGLYDSGLGNLRYGDAAGAGLLQPKYYSSTTLNGGATTVTQSGASATQLNSQTANPTLAATQTGASASATGGQGGAGGTGEGGAGGSTGAISLTSTSQGGAGGAGGSTGAINLTNTPTFNNATSGGVVGTNYGVAGGATLSGCATLGTGYSTTNGGASILPSSLYNGTGANGSLMGTLDAGSNLGTLGTDAGVAGYGSFPSTFTAGTETASSSQNIGCGANGSYSGSYGLTQPTNATGAGSTATTTPGSGSSVTNTKKTSSLDFKDMKQMNQNFELATSSSDVVDRPPNVRVMAYGQQVQAMKYAA